MGASRTFREPTMATLNKRAFERLPEQTRDIIYSSEKELPAPGNAGDSDQRGLPRGPGATEREEGTPSVRDERPVFLTIRHYSGKYFGIKQTFAELWELQTRGRFPNSETMRVRGSGDDVPLCSIISRYETYV